MYSRARMKRWFPPVTLALAFVLFRVPALLNPGFINSDGAISGLQANRMLEGEWQWLHWARDYLTSIDSVIALPFLALFGSTPFVLMCVTLFGQLTTALLAYAIAERRIGPWPAVLVSLPLVFMTMGVNIYLFFNVRMWCLAMMLGAFLLIDRSVEAARPRLTLALGILLGFLSMFADLYASQLIPGLLLFAILSGLDGTSLRWKAFPPVLKNVGAATALATVVLVVLRRLAEVRTGRATLNMRQIPYNWSLFTDECFQWMAGTKLFAFNASGGAELHPSPGWIAVLQVLGLVTLVLLLVSGAALFFMERIPWRIRVLGAVGSGVAFSTCFGFLCSNTAVDIWGTRLLLPLILTLPLTLAPVTHVLGKRAWIALLPYLLSTAITGWLSYGVFVDGLVPVRTTRGAMTEERAVGEFLRAKGIRYAAADYWVAYRLSFILGENPIVVPEASEDRYPKWRARFDAEPHVAYLVHPSSPALSAEAIEAALVERKQAFERSTVEGFTVFEVTR